MIIIFQVLTVIKSKTTINKKFCGIKNSTSDSERAPLIMFINNVSIRTINSYRFMVIQSGLEWWVDNQVMWVDDSGKILLHFVQLPLSSNATKLLWLTNVFISRKICIIWLMFSIDKHSFATFFSIVKQQWQQNSNN